MKIQEGGAEAQGGATVGSWDGGWSLRTPTRGTGGGKSDLAGKISVPLLSYRGCSVSAVGASSLQTDMGSAGLVGAGA